MHEYTLCSCCHKSLDGIAYLKDEYSGEKTCERCLQVSVEVTYRNKNNQILSYLGGSSKYIYANGLDGTITIDGIVRNQVQRALDAVRKYVTIANKIGTAPNSSTTEPEKTKETFEGIDEVILASQIDRALALGDKESFLVLTAELNKQKAGN